ncbi:excisionase family DNA-binding protein [Nocardioides sp. NPDC006303]|uniref:excisionase family DNA-binding protein n=1 Tax=Nocardioides sp. NPDC006303 TaxID=3156747 RepID=UPI0033AC9C28
MLLRRGRGCFLTVREVAEQLGFGETKVRTLIAQGRIRSLEDGRSRRVLPHPNVSMQAGLYAFGTPADSLRFAEWRLSCTPTSMHGGATTSARC